MSTQIEVKAPRFVKSYRDRNGKPRLYFRRKGVPTIVLKGPVGSAEFEAAYQEALRLAPHYRSRSAPDAGYVYVIGVRGFDLAKIGYSHRPEERLAALEAGSGMAGGLELLIRYRARRSVEGQLHRQFADQRLFGEWFRLSGPLEEWIRTPA